MAGDIDVISRGCKMLTVPTPTIGDEELSEEENNLNNENSFKSNHFSCKHAIGDDYETTCTCTEEYCNDKRYPTPTKVSPMKGQILGGGDSFELLADELNKSIRQLRADIKRTIKEEVRKANLCNN